MIIQPGKLLVMGEMFGNGGVLFFLNSEEESVKTHSIPTIRNKYSMITSIFGHNNGLSTV